MSPVSPPRTVELSAWDGDWPADDPFAELKSDVTAYGNLDPLGTLEHLSIASGIPLGALVRYVVARWASGGNEAVLEIGVSGVDHLARVVEEAEVIATDEARLVAFRKVRDLVRWLRAGLEQSG